MKFNDTINLESQREYTPEGFLITDARISRTGIQVYLEKELNPESLSNKPVRVLRPESEVFSKESMESFQNKSVTNGHPQENVSIENAKELTVGMSGETVVREGDFLKAKLIFFDKQTISDIENGKAEVSNGYIADVEMTPGHLDDGQEYDAVQGDIRGNHIAIVEKGRAGHSCKILDNNGGNLNMAKCKIDGVEYEVSDQVAQAVGKLQEKMKDMETKTKDEMEEKEAETKEAVKAKDALQAELDDAKSKILNDEKVEQLINEKISLITDAKKINPDLEVKDKANDEIIKMVVADKCPELEIETLSKDYLQARFDLLLEDSGKTKEEPSKITKALADGAIVNDGDNLSPYEKARKNFIDSQIKGE